MRQFSASLMALVALLSASVVMPDKAQAQLLPDAYFNIDWQLGMPLSNDFADDLSGWGMNLEGGYFLTDAITIGGFLNFQTSFEKFGRQTLSFGDGSALTTSQKHAIFQLPFGVSGRYNWRTERVVQPYVGMKLGASYAQISSYYYIYKQYDETWGFYLQPEAGLSLFPRPDMRFGFHAAIYFSYATNKGGVLNYEVDGLTNVGLRVGISF